MAREIVNVGASVQSRLLQVSKRMDQNFDLVLNRYTIERLLYRLTRSNHADRFVLKGAMLMMTWFDEPFRITRDLDLLGFGDPNPGVVLEIFREIFRIEERDGVCFDASRARIGHIREDTEYGGLRIRTMAEIGGARITVKIDVGFGDATDPEPEKVEYPVLLDMPPPRLHGYSRETVIAEKFQNMVVIGQLNSRMKDYFDIWILSQSFEFERSRLAQAISSTFARRRTAIPKRTPDALSPAFVEDEHKQKQWKAFVQDVETAPGSLAEVVATLEEFLMSAAEAAIDVGQ